MQGMKASSFISFLLLLWLIFTGCSTGSDPVHDPSQVEVGDLSFSVKPLPPTEESWRYVVRISHQGQQSLLKSKAAGLEDYQRAVDYLAFQAAQDLALVVGQDTLPCALHHFERKYDVAPFVDLIAVFPQAGYEEASPDALLFSPTLFEVGKLHFSLTQYRD